MAIFGSGAAASLPFFLLDGLVTGSRMDAGGRLMEKEDGRALVIGRERAGDGDAWDESR